MYDADCVQSELVPSGGVELVEEVVVLGDWGLGEGFLHWWGGVGVGCIGIIPVIYIIMYYIIYHTSYIYNTQSKNTKS